MKKKIILMGSAPSDPTRTEDEMSDDILAFKIGQIQMNIGFQTEALDLLLAEQERRTNG